MTAEADRALVWQVDAHTGAHRPYATGLRNPTALAMQPGTGQPYSYWGQHLDIRVRPQDPQKVASAIPPDYSLGSHVAALGLAFSQPVLGAAFADGVFVGQHGSWNRTVPVGYRVIFVPFRAGRPAGVPVDFVTGFRGEDGKTRGRPAGVTVDPKGALIVADDLSNTIWRVTSTR
jgi:glucose/arabinose dehydrogenase